MRRPLAEESDAAPADINRLYRSEAPKLLRFFGKRLGPDQAADLVQESFLRLVRRTQAPDPIASPSGYPTWRDIDLRQLVVIGRVVWCGRRLH